MIKYFSEKIKRLFKKPIDEQLEVEPETPKETK